jgi:hypothetical protein
VTQAVKRGTLAKAVLPGGRLDAAHPDFIAWLSAGAKTKSTGPAQKKTPAPTAPRPKKPRAAPPPPQPKRRGRSAKRAEQQLPEDLEPGEAWPPPSGAASDEDLADLASALAPLVARFGTHREFGDWLERLKRIEEIREKRLKNEETEGTLIERDLVATHLFGAIEAANRRLLGDAPKTIARVVYGHANSGDDIEKAEKAVREMIGAQLKPVKDHAARALRNA